MTSSRVLAANILITAASFAATIPTGPSVGQKAFDFNLKDQKGVSRNLSSVLGPRGALLVFYRSCDWWPYCKAQLVELEQNADRIRGQGLGIAAISYDSMEATRQFTERMHISFPLLSDTGSEVIKRYGILNETVDPKSAFYGIPHPGTYVLDATGEITAKYFEEDYKTRDTSASILLRHFGLSPVPAHQPVSAKHIGLSTSSTASEGRTGQRLTLTLDGELAPKMHVYAPGIKGYIPIALTFEKPVGFSTDPPIYPQSKTMRIKVIKETVPVYEGRFRVMQTVRLADAAELEPLLDKDRNLSIHATFRYQACDDKECYVPETVPLTWTLHVLPLDTVRVR